MRLLFSLCCTLAFAWGQDLPYRVVGEWAVVEGDIIIGRASDIEQQQKNGGARAASVIDSANRRWPKVGAVHEIPYVNPNNFAPTEEAIRIFNETFTGVIQFVRRTNQPDYVEILMNPQGNSGCSAVSAVGRVGGRQTIEGSGSANGDICVSVLLHEIGHTVGLYHEQSRRDHPGHIQPNWPNLADRQQYDVDDNGKDVGFYDSASIMHYGVHTLARNQYDVTMETIPSGIPVGETNRYSDGDIDVVRRMYGATPSQVTIATNPAGLTVHVDGTPARGSATFNWPMNSQHTLEVPASLQLQTLNGRDFLFGRWNHVPYDGNLAPGPLTVTVAPGEGTIDLLPAARPRATVYLAAFRELVPLARLPQPSATPAEGGQARFETAPTNIQGRDYYFATQPLTARATPAEGFNFYSWMINFSTSSNLFGNPRNLRAGIGGSIQARFTRDPVVRVLSSPTGIPIKVDTTDTTDKAFANEFDTGWGPGTTHTISAPAVAASVVDDPRARMAFSNWSDGGAATHQIQVGGSTTLVANYKAQYQLQLTQDVVGGTCAADLRTEPAAADGFYDAGTPVTVTAAPKPGWNFIRWQGGFGGTNASTVVTMNGSRQGEAVFNVTNQPLAITSLSPATAPLNGEALTLTVNGSGFTPNTLVCLFQENGNNDAGCERATGATLNRFTIRVGPELLAQAQNLQVVLFNENAGCDVRTAAILPVRAPVITPPPTTPTQTRISVSLRGWLGWMAAEGGGGSAVNANRATVSLWERLTLTDLNGGELQSGDRITLQAANGQYLTAEGGGGGEVNANRGAASTWETFTIDLLPNSSNITLRSANGSYLVTEPNGRVMANRGSASTWETFLLQRNP